MLWEVNNKISHYGALKRTKNPSGCCLSGKEMLKPVQYDQYIASSSARVEFSAD